MFFYPFFSYSVFDNSTSSLWVKRFLVASTNSVHRQIKSFSFLQRISQWVFLLSCCPQQHPVEQWSDTKIVYETDESPTQLGRPCLNQCACVVHTQWHSCAPSLNVLNIAEYFLKSRLLCWRITSSHHTFTLSIMCYSWCLKNKMSVILLLTPLFVE